MSGKQTIRDRGLGAGERRPRGVAARREGLGRPLRRFGWVTFVVVLLALGAGFYSASTLATTYTGRASLIVSSNNRSPDQDAVLVQGYVDYFNDVAYQQQLARSAGLRGDLTLTARAAAASPILLVEATTNSRDTAQAAAAEVAEAFQTDLNRVRDQEQRRQVNELEARLAQVVDEGGEDAATSIATLQDQIAEVQSDRTNRLQELQFEGGVSTNVPSTLTNLVLGVLGGSILGILAAVGLDRVIPPRRPQRPDRPPLSQDSLRRSPAQ